MKMIFHKFLFGIQRCIFMNKRSPNTCSVKFFWGVTVVMLFGLMISTPKSGQSVEDNPPKNPDEKQDRINTDHMVYDSYCKKTWVVDGEDFYDGYGFSLSIIITRIGEGTVEGHIALNNGTVRYNIDGTWNDSYPEFRGTVHNGKALCKYMDKKGETHSFDLTFHDENCIQAMMDGDENKSYMLRPYNISDLYYINEPTQFEAELDGWGTVTVFYANSLSNHTTPNVMLIDENGNILFDFVGGTYGYQSGTEVLDIIIRDMNRDGLEDMEIITCGFDGMGEEKWCAEWYFYQQKDGMFIYDETGFISAKNKNY